MLQPLEIFFWALVLAWLFVCVVFDLKSRQVPALLTIVPLGLACIFRALTGEWKAVLLVVALVLISDLPFPRWHLSIGLLTVTALSLIGQSGNVSLNLALFASWALWELGAMGGADAKMLLALALLFGDGRMVLLVLSAGGVQGLVALALKRREIPYTLSIAAGAVAWFALAH